MGGSGKDQRSETKDQRPNLENVLADRRALGHGKRHDHTVEVRCEVFVLRLAIGLPYPGEIVFMLGYHHKELSRKPFVGC